jgi:Ferritin-like domain
MHGLDEPEQPSLGGDADVIERSSRAHLLARGLATAGALGFGGAILGSLSGTAASAPSPAQDVRILNYLLELEYLQQAFYEEAQTAGALKGELRRFARVVGNHEREHVAALRTALGSKAASKPEFHFGDAVKSDRKFAATALRLEETTAAAYIGQAANMTEQRIVTLARIVPVEARHAAWIRAILHRLPAPQAADPASTPEQVERTLERTGFVQER